MDNPPFGSVCPDGQSAGFGVAAWSVIASTRSVKVRLEQIVGANRIPYLLTSRIDRGDGRDAQARCAPSRPVRRFKCTTEDLPIAQLAPRALSVRFEDSATSNTACLFDRGATPNTIAVAPSKKHSQPDTELTFKLRGPRAHMARQGNFENAALDWRASSPTSRATVY